MVIPRCQEEHPRTKKYRKYAVVRSSGAEHRPFWGYVGALTISIFPLRGYKGKPWRVEGRARAPSMSAQMHLRYSYCTPPSDRSPGSAKVLLPLSPKKLGSHVNHS